MKKLSFVNVLRFLALAFAIALFVSPAFAATPPQISAGQIHTAGLKSDGTVVATGTSNLGNLDVGSWSNIIQISANSSNTVGLKADGTVVAVGYNNAGQTNVSGWTNIVQVESSFFDHTIGLKADGTVVIVGDYGYGQNAVLSWTGIKQISSGNCHIVGLKSDGTVVAAGSNSNGQLNVSTWSGITQISAGGDHTVGLKADGTVVACGEYSQGQCNVSGWSGITQVSAGVYHTVGLKSDGTVVAVGLNVSPDYAGGCDTQSWTDIVQVSAGYYYTVGLKADGSVMTTGSNYWGQLNGISSWNLGVTDVTVAVPNVITLSDTIAEKTITDAKLKVGAWDSNYSIFPINTVISQNPAAGVKVKKGSSVMLTVSIGAPPAATAMLKMLNKATKAPLAGVRVTIKDKKGTALQIVTTDIYGMAIVNMPQAGQYSFYEVKAGFTPVLSPDVQVLNKGAKNSIVSYMTAIPVAKVVKVVAVKK